MEDCILHAAEIILYGAMNTVSVGSESKYTYQTICEDLEPILSIEVLLFKDTCKERVNTEARKPGS